MTIYRYQFAAGESHFRNIDAVFFVEIDYFYPDNLFRIWPYLVESRCIWRDPGKSDSESESESASGSDFISPLSKYGFLAYFQYESSFIYNL